MASPAPKTDGLFGEHEQTILTEKYEHVLELRRQLEVAERSYHDLLAQQTRQAVQADPDAKPAEKKHHAIKAVLTHFDKRHEEKIGERAKLEGGRDARIMQGLVNRYGEERTCELIDEFFALDDEFIAQRTGYTVPALSSKVPALMSSKAVPIRAHGITPRTQHNRTSSSQAAAMIRRNFGHQA